MFVFFATLITAAMSIKHVYHKDILWTSTSSPLENRRTSGCDHLLKATTSPQQPIFQNTKNSVISLRTCIELNAYL